VPLDAHLKRILDMLAAAGHPDPANLGLGERREAFRKLMGLSQANVSIGGLQDRTLPGPGGDIPIRVYTPAGAGSEMLPGLVFFHGGGLVAGSLDTHDGLCRALANETGCRLVSVAYRLAPEHPFPAAVMDGCAATAWVAVNAVELGISRDRIAVGGDSAGGTLAAVVCQFAGAQSALKLSAQLLLCPILDYAGQTGSRSAYAKDPLVDKTTMDRDLERYVPAGVDIADPRISPLRAADFGRLPRACIHTAEFDPLRDEGQAYAERLSQAGVAVKYTCHAGMAHLFYAMTGVIPYARAAMKVIGAEFKAALA
jgi:acetyl esterase/lipase